MFDDVSNHPGYVVPPHSRSDIISFTQRVRAKYNVDPRAPFPVWDLIEDVGFLENMLGNYEFQVVTAEEIGQCEGLVPFNVQGKNELLLREDVYEGLTQGKTRPRFTAAHELGHLILRHNLVRGDGLARITKEVPKFKQSEWQANTFAGALLLSPELARESDNPYTAAFFANMSPQAAEITMESYQKERML